MTTTVSAVDARRCMGRLLNIVLLKDEEVIIERAGKPVARLTGCRTKQARATGKLDFRKARGLGKAMWRAIDVPQYVARERSQWD